MVERWPIVGMGAICSLGSTARETFDALCAGRSGLAPIRGFTTDWYTSDSLFEIDDRDDSKDRPGRATGFLLSVIAEALTDAGLSDDLGDVPVLVGTGLRELRSVELWRGSGAAVTPAELHFGAAVRSRFGAWDTHTFSNACSASLYALSLATDLLSAGEADTVVVAGTDSITESMFGVADRVQSIPPDAVRPFDRERRGTILGEGAAAVVLRREPGTGGSPRGWVRGVEVNCDAHHPTAPEAGSIAGAMRAAHQRAGVTPADIDLVMLHGTGTIANDLGEALAMREVYGEDLARPVCTAMKSMTGHTSGASGLHSLITALQSMDAGRVVPVPTLEKPIDEMSGFRLAREQAVPVDARLAQINAFGFGGINAVTVVEGNR
ncbi:beta-ketoacyl synthase N-terminal-like domain-containing protein [Actinoplanes aureus]|uniref:3-oxoacyl-ACP synthase n=1 Tax=Actinoplanes aureus TaxID=2792083 RepID=A0A931G2J4_9ACTN|nr:beta-ketoacyl synthase N-terminal-like domain-containing protein [Actinoplanes aureus]MBG0567777.1 3-oxoacyl-ACP synthase [Actinoplanes aureus]